VIWSQDAALHIDHLTVLFFRLGIAALIPECNAQVGHRLQYHRILRAQSASSNLDHLALQFLVLVEMTLVSQDKG